MAKRPCARPGCAALVAKGYCEAHKKDSAAARRVVVKAALISTKWYNSKRWKATRIGFFMRHPLCADPYSRHGAGPVAATDLDHKTPHKEDFGLFWDPTNWQGLCKACHSYKTAMEDGGFGRGRGVKSLRPVSF